MRWILLLPLLVLLVLFGLSNRQEVALGLWPFDLTWAVPLSVAVLLIAALAFLLGALVAWAAGLPQRHRARRTQAAAGLLQAEIAELRGQMARDVGPAGAPPSAAGSNVARLPSRAA
jgi:lipopolysaccharide assembly protein A